MVRTAMATPHPAICWTSFYKSRKTPTLPPLAQWVQGRGPDRVLGRDQDRVRAVVHQQAELQVAEQVRTSTIKPYKTVYTCNIKLIFTLLYCK